MASWRIAEHKIRAAAAAGELSGLEGEGRPLPLDALEGLSGDALQEALICRSVGVPPPEVEALRRVGEARSRVSSASTPEEAEAARRALALAEMEAGLLLERSGRMVLAGQLGGVILP